jgi:hypothetical protein
MIKKTAILLAAWVLGSAAYAQVSSPSGPLRPHGGFGPMGLGAGMRPWKIVTGAPYSANVTNQFVETLPDGNTIQRTTTGSVARDSQGRTYSQETITGGPLASNGPTTLTFISDPVAGYTYVLNATTKIANRRPLKTPPANSPREHKSSPNVVETDLGTQTVNGVTAQGKSITRTIPAGQIGNAQAIVSTSENWYSPDLQIVVSSKRTDPRMGQSTYSVTNIQRTEPNASLFQVPAGYTVKDAPAWRGPGGGPPPPEQ